MYGTCVYNQIHHKEAVHWIMLIQGDNFGRNEITHSQGELCDVVYHKPLQDFL